MPALPDILSSGAGIRGGILGYPWERLHQEVAYIAYHFHWPQSEIMALEHADRRRWVYEIDAINRKMNESNEDNG